MTTTSSRAQTGEDTASAVAQTVAVSLASWSDSDVDPIVPSPCVRCGRCLRAAVASIAWTGHRIGPRSRGSLVRPARPFADGSARTFRWGSKLGSPGEHRAMGFGHGPIVATDFRAEQGLEVAAALPLNDRGAWTRGDARTASRKGEALKGRHRWESVESSQACGGGAWQPDEPQGRMRDATSPRICRRRKPSRPGGTARAERARHREMPGRSGRKLAGVDSSRVADGGEVFEKPYGRRLARSEPGGCERRLRQRKMPARGERCGPRSTSRARGARHPLSRPYTHGHDEWRHRGSPSDPVPRAVK
jgi:hypothetical protein